MNRKINITRKSLCVILGIISLSVFTLTIAYAALSTTLNITGNAEVNASTWNFSLVSGMATGPVGEIEGGFKTFGTATSQQPTFNDTTMTYSLSLTNPGDSVLFAFNIKNNGTINGEIESIIHSTPKCTSSTGNTEDANLVCNNLLYEIGYLNGTYDKSFSPISPGDIISTVENHNLICLANNGEKTPNKTTLLKISLNPEMTQVPSSTVTITNMSTTINIIQTDKKCTGSAATPEK